KVVEDIMEFGNVQKGLLGVSAANVNSPQAIEQGIDQLNGVYVATVEEGSGAHEAGLEPGDVIKKVDDMTIHRFAELTGYLSSKRPGDVVTVTVQRKGEELSKRVTLKKQQSLILPVTGFTVKNISKEDK